MQRPMTLDLIKSLEVDHAQVAAVVNGFMTAQAPGLVALGPNHRIDPAAAVAAHPFTDALMRQPWASAELRSAAVRAAIMLARPEPATST